MTVPSLLMALVILLITTISLVSVGLIIGSRMDSPEGFQLISSFLLFPMFFLSGALFPLDRLPSWLAPFIFLDPLTYAVDALRKVILGASHFHLALDLGVVTAFAGAMIALGTYAFERMKV
jgi:ABC-2 type transport system permease protein